MSISQKLILGFLTVAVLVAVVGYFGVRTTGQARETAELDSKVDSLLLKVTENDSIVSAAISTQDLADFDALARQANGLDDEVHVLFAELLEEPELQENADFRRFIETEGSNDALISTLMQNHT